MATGLPAGTAKCKKIVNDFYFFTLEFFVRDPGKRLKTAGG